MTNRCVIDASPDDDDDELIQVFDRFQPRFDNLLMGFFDAHVLLFGVIFRETLKRGRRRSQLSAVTVRSCGRSYFSRNSPMS